MTQVSEDKRRLQALIERAEAIVDARGCYYTDGAKLAIDDLMQAAREALKGENGLPFKRNREFYAPREEEAVLFATKRYTMVPPFVKESSVYTSYGMESALEWFEEQDLLRGGKERLVYKADLALSKANELLHNARIGEEVGCLDDEAVRKLRASAATVEQLKPSSDDALSDHSSEELALAVVACFNRIRECRYSRVLRTDVDPYASLYLTGEGLQQVKAVIESDPLVREQYERIAGIAGHFSLDDLEKAVANIKDGESDYDELNQHFYLWSSTDKIVNFQAPEHAAKASISFVLPSEENEEEGLGHVWIDQLEILSASGGSLKIRNAGFDEGIDSPDFWIPEARKGNPRMRWESEYPYCGGGDRKRLEPANPSSQVATKRQEGVRNHSLYLCNPAREDEAAWTCIEPFDVESGVGYTLTFQAKLDGKLKAGLKTVVTYYNEFGAPIGEYTYLFNRKSSIPGGRFQLAMQCDAIQYALTGEIEYAMKVKYALLYILHDFSQGAEHWMVTNLRPEGSDSYGAVQGGRLLSSAAVSYSMIKQAHVFSGEEKRQFYALVEYLLRYMLDLRDRTEWTPREAQEGCSNWQTDMCAGTGLMMMALTDFPNRHTWLYNADAILKAQLELNVNPDSSWPESIRYHHAALERFAGYAKAARNVLGDDWFETTPLARMFGFSIEMQTPGYEYFGGRIGTPPFGDHALGDGSEFGSFATYLADVAKVDRKLADRMYHTWTAAGKPFKKLWGEGIVLENLLGQGDNYVPSTPLELSSTASFPDAGIYIFRNETGDSKQSYFGIMSSPEPIAHGHLDQGAFVIYKNNIPLVMDSGIEGYFDSGTSWHISSYSHACLQFATRQTVIPSHNSGAINLSAGTYSLERGWVDVPRTSKVLEVQLGEDLERITIEIANPEGQGRHFRHVTYVKQADLYVIRDTVEDFTGLVQFTIPVASKQTKVEGSALLSEGVYGVDLETVFIRPLQSIKVEKGRSTPFFDSGDDGVTMMEYIRAVADASEGFLTVLYPKERGQQKLRTKTDQDGTIILHAGKLSYELKAAPEQYGVVVSQTEREGAEQR
jgi:hypothetical protein